MKSTLFLATIGFMMPSMITAQPLKGTSQDQYAHAVSGINSKGVGIYGEGLGAGVMGKNTGNWYGVYGESPNFTAIGGQSTNASGVGGVSTKWYGVYGESVESHGVYGISKGKGAGVFGKSSGVGVWGEGETWNGVVGISKSTTGGAGVYGYNANGTAIFSDGKLVTKTVEILGGSDIAEHFKTSDSKKNLEAGTLMVADEKNQGAVLPSSVAYDKKVVGVVSGANGVKTGMTLRQEGTLEGEAVISVAGRVYVKASTLNGKIKVGDLLTSSNLAGYAMKATHKRKSNGSIIGKALTALETKEGLVLILVNLQ